MTTRATVSSPIQATATRRRSQDPGVPPTAESTTWVLPLPRAPTTACARGQAQVTASRIRAAIRAATSAWRSTPVIGGRPARPGG